MHSTHWYTLHLITNKQDIVLDIVEKSAEKAELLLVNPEWYQK